MNIFDNKENIKNYKHSIEELKKDILKALVWIKMWIILRHYKSCLKKIDLYKKKI